jgi:hypothetical protein
MLGIYQKLGRQLGVKLRRVVKAKCARLTPTMLKKEFGARCVYVGDGVDVWVTWLSLSWHF